MRDTEDEWAHCPLAEGQHAVHVGVVVLTGGQTRLGPALSLPPACLPCGTGAGRYLAGGWQGPSNGRRMVVLRPYGVIGCNHVMKQRER